MASTTKPVRIEVAVSLPIVMAVAVGGACGAVARYLVAVGTTALIGHGFPLATVIVNIFGSFVMGALIAFGALRLDLSAELRGLLAIGLLGAFTTFSTFSLDAVSLYERGRTIAACLYVLISVTGSIGALIVGLAVVRRLSNA